MQAAPQSRMQHVAGHVRNKVVFELPSVNLAEIRTACEGHLENYNQETQQTTAVRIDEDYYDRRKSTSNDRHLH